jgi:RNA polymerase sigma-70 factor (ECF subfamily)
VDRLTFDRLMLDHLSAAHRFAIRLCGDAAQAEDLVHDALVRAAGAWASFRADASFKTWLFQILVNVFRDRLRRRAAAPRELPEVDLGELDAPLMDPLSTAMGEELGELIARRVSALPPRQREVLVLVAYEGMTPSQAGEVLGISEPSARTSLHHARQRLKRQLAPYLSESKRDAT